MVKQNPLHQTDRKNLTARITTVNEANGQSPPTSSGNGSLFRKVKDALLPAILLLALVALMGAWVFALGWMALRLISWIFA
jgi:hypothetical protein